MGYRRSNTFQSNEDPSAKNTHGIGEIFHEVTLLVKFFLLGRRLGV